LRELGYRVAEAESGEAALAAATSGEVFDIMVTDQAMPGMTGLQLIAAMRELRPGLPVLLVTGFTDLDVGGEVQLLAKPFRHVELAQAVAGLLAARVRVS
jgi:CheY-like chemotaxis protein